MGRLAIVCVVLAACGSHSGTKPDGSTTGDGSSGGDGSGSASDAAIDVPNVRGTVMVEVTNATTMAASCAPGLHVVFIDTDGTTTDLQTDAMGHAQGDVFPGASVTVVCSRTTGSFTVVTIQDIEPGDDLVLNAAAFLTGTQTADATSAGSFHVAYSAYTGAAGYTIYHPCGNMTVAGTAGTLAMEMGCVEPTMDLVVVALGNTGTPAAFTSASGVAFTSGGSYTISDTWHPLAPVTATYSNAPAFCADTNDPNYPCNAELDRYTPDLRGLRDANAMDIAAAPVSFPVTAPVPAHAAMQTIFSTAAAVKQISTKIVDGTQTTYALDLTATELPWLCLGVTVDCPVWNKPDPQMIGVPVTGNQPIDIFEVDATYVRGQTIYVWRAFGPTLGDFMFPTLPASVPAVKPQPNDTKSATHAYACESDAIAGYRPARQNVFDSLETCKASPSPTAKRLPGTFNRLSSVN